TDIFSYTVTDSDGSTAIGHVTITIVDDVPTANSDPRAADSGQTLSVDAQTGVLSNDVFGADGKDADGGVVGVATGSDTSSPLSGNVGSEIPGSFGKLTLNADGSYTYIANANAEDGVDHFVYTIKDGDGDLSTATLDITVHKTGPSPVSASVLVDEAALDLTKDGADLAAGAMTGTNPSSMQETASGTLNLPAGVTVVAGAQQDQEGSFGLGLLHVNTDGTFVYTLVRNLLTDPANDGRNNVNGAETFTVAIQDAAGNASTGTITVNITDDAPVLSINNGILRNEPGITVTGRLADIGADVQGATLALSNDVTALNNLKLKSLDQIVIHSVSADGTTLTATAAGDVVFTLTTNAGNGTYTLTTFRPLDLALLESKISSSSVGGAPQPAYYIYNDGRVSAVNTSGGSPGQDWEVKISGFGNDRVQAATDGFGLNNNLMNVGETVRFELDNEGASGGKDVIYQVKIGLNQQFDPANIKLSYTASVVNGSDQQVATISGTNNTDVTRDATGHWILTVKMTSAQIQAGYMLDYVDVTVASVTNNQSFKIDSWQSFSLQDGPPVTLPVAFATVDGDGDSESGVLHLSFQNQLLLQGGSGNEVLVGGAGNEILIGGAGNDILVGGAGNDIFRWLAADKGTLASPAVDKIVDFGNGNNALDLKDLLTGEHDGAGASLSNLSAYLHFSYDATTNTTTLNVNSQGSIAGGAVDQQIVLLNFDVTPLGGSDGAIIQNLLNQGRLITDH
ncbi:MAG: type I secretion C-terminal target domain-containing protein, partial [Betaproteobacteria bacterium]|nr:type I secretion C-terminal target domain-containing protein [Betaproteobacteria bacterium]